MALAREGRTGPTAGPYESETVLRRDEHIYARNLDDLMEMFRAAPKILDDMGFQEIREEYSEHWETLPFKTGVEARKWKDPYTAIMLDFTARVKEPRSDRKTDDDVYKVKFTLKAEVIKSRYPHWEWFEETTMLKRSGFYQWLQKLVDNIIFPGQRQKYEEEAEELGIEFTSRIRELEGSLPAIGKSSREFYNPHGPD